MKRMLIAGGIALAAGGQALAADLPPPVAPPPRAPATYVPIAPAYNWSGFYIGGNLGGAFTGGSFSDSYLSGVSTSNTSSFIGGGQVGVNYEFWGGVVIGAEADFDYLANSKNNISLTSTAATGSVPATATINNQWLTTVTGRVGYAWDRVLLYGKGGAAWVGTNSPGFSTAAGAFGMSSSSNNIGWTAGLGVEWAFYGNWSARAEYDYVGLSNQNYTVSSTAGSPFANDVLSGSSRNIQMVTAGLNYKFGPWW